MRTKIYREVDEDEEIEITVEFHYSRGTNDYFDKSFGNWLPGDPPDFHIIKATTEHGEEIGLTDDEISEVEGQASDIYEDAIGDAEIDRYEDMLEDRYDIEMSKF